MVSRYLHRRLCDQETRRYKVPGYRSLTNNGDVEQAEITCPLERDQARLSCDVRTLLQVWLAGKGGGWEFESHYG
jgi:hypothetical protein